MKVGPISGLKAQGQGHDTQSATQILVKASFQASTSECQVAPARAGGSMANKAVNDEMAHWLYERSVQGVWVKPALEVGAWGRLIQLDALRELAQAAKCRATLSSELGVACAQRLLELGCGSTTSIAQHALCSTCCCCSSLELLLAWLR